MKDALGNSLEPGNLVLWNQLIAKVKEVHDGGLTVMRKGGGVESTPTIVLELKLQNPPAASIIRVVDPNATKLLESIAEAGD